jgi:alpha-L-rhamnosidase
MIISKKINKMDKNRILSYTLAVSLLLVSAACNKDVINGAHDLTVSEGFTNPVGFYDNNPTFSWKLPPDIQVQGAYSIVVASSPELLPDKPDLWESGKVDSEETLFVKYEGEKLSSRQKAFWQVMVWDQNGNESQWSETAHLELGLLNNKDWNGNWISIPAEALMEKDARGSLLFRPQYMRKEIKLNSRVKRARLYITAKGVYEAYINGTKVGTDVMSPGWTPVSKSISTLTYDVTDMLKEGENTIGAVVAEGWHSGRINLRSTLKTVEHTPRLLCQLEIEDADGTQTIVSDASWKVTQNGPIRSSKIYDGETYDARYELGEWSSNGYDDSNWLSVTEQGIADSILLLPKRYEGVKDKSEIAVKNITEPEAGKPIFDFGQNNVGVPLVNVPMKKGDTLSIRFAEMLDKDGTLYTDNYRSALSTDYYVAAKDGLVQWRPTFTFHGYRYIELSGFSPDEKPQKNWISAIVQYSDFEMNGIFSSSHEKLNQLQSNITWGLKSNFFDIPTDCPQRDERLGWTGDAQVIAPTSIYNAEMYAFWAGWLQSVRQDQRADGGIPNVIPDNLGNNSSPGWGDACVIVPWELYFRTGDESVLEENYEMMNRWLDFYATKATGHIVSMFAFGDWLQPHPQPNKKDPRLMRRGDTPAIFVATAYYARSIELTIRSTKVLKKSADVAQLQGLYEEVKAAFEQEFFDADGRVKFEIETQTEYLMALAFNLLSQEKQQLAAKHLMRVIAECDNHLRTGFLGTPILPLVLDDLGEIDLMYTILFQETYPSWFYSINQGATTMWERWDSYTHENGFHTDGMNSFNHYAYGAIGQWMYERVAGIKPTKAGYKEILIAPIPGGPLTSAEASYDSPYGLVSSAWKTEDGTFMLQATVPPNTTAKIIIPANTDEDLLLNGSQFSENPGIKLLKKGEGTFELMAQPGEYEFEASLAY